MNTVRRLIVRQDVNYETDRATLNMPLPWPESFEVITPLIITETFKLHWHSDEKAEYRGPRGQKIIVLNR
jgi:hypothetical protein